MKYLLMICFDEAADARKSGEVLQQEHSAYMTYTNQVAESGALRGGEALHPTSMATTVRVRDGKVLTTDGPFAETKEQMGGFYLVECANLDDAIQWASRIPHASQGSIEIRPVIDFSAGAAA